MFQSYCDVIRFDRLRCFDKLLLRLRWRVLPESRRDVCALPVLDTDVIELDRRSRSRLMERRRFDVIELVEMFELSRRKL